MNEPVPEEASVRLDCHEAQQQTHALLDGELNPGLSALLTKHLAACPECGKRADFEAAFFRALARCPGGADMSVHVKNRIQLALKEWEQKES